MNDDKNQTDDSKDQTVEPVVPTDTAIEESSSEPASEKETEEAPVVEEAPESVSTEDAPAAPVVNSDSTGTDQQGRQLYTVKCSTCGKDTQVPFKPTDGRPVYCRDDFMKMRNSQ